MRHTPTPLVAASARYAQFEAARNAIFETDPLTVLLGKPAVRHAHDELMGELLSETTAIDHERLIALTTAYQDALRVFSGALGIKTYSMFTAADVSRLAGLVSVIPAVATRRIRVLASLPLDELTMAAMDALYESQPMLALLVDLERKGPGLGSRAYQGVVKLMGTDRFHPPEDVVQATVAEATEGIPDSLVHLSGRVALGLYVSRRGEGGSFDREEFRSCVAEVVDPPRTQKGRGK